jgi:RNA polymerase sigma-70 factor (ECF subfamily)
MQSEAFERLFADHAGPLLAFLFYRTGDRALSEDLVADTFERALRARRGFDRRKASEKTWLYSIALNCVRDHARRREAEQRAYQRDLARVSTTGEPLDAIDDRDLVARALKELSVEEREAIALRYGADLTVPEIAKLQREKLSTVEGRVYRALRKLRAELE